jgi:hypothetical protein
MAEKPDGNFVALLVGFLSLLIAIVGFLFPAIYHPSNAGAVSWQEKLAIVLALGPIGAILYGSLWSGVAQKILGTNYGEETSMPSGWHAVVLSLCLTLPITCLPPLCEVVTGARIISSRNYLYGAIYANLGSAFGHLIWYGIRAIPFRGLREMIFPVGAPPNGRRYVAMEVVVTLMHFLSTVAVFRTFADNQDSVFGPSAVVLPTLLSGLFFWSGICFYSLVKYPESLLDQGGWAQVRGVLAGFLLCFSLTGGLLM